MLSCNEVSRLVAGDLRREPWWRRINVRIHLMACDGCRRFAEEISALDRAVKRTPSSKDTDVVRQSSERLIGRVVEQLRTPRPTDGP